MNRERLLPAGLVLLIVMAWLVGGVVGDSSSRDEAVELLALPVFAMAAIALLREAPGDRWLRLGALAMLLAACLPALQLLPLPEALSSLASARRAVSVDQLAAGVEAAPRWSLAPYATEQALWAFMPALAAFLAGLAMPSRFRSRLLALSVVLVLLNLPFALFQTGLPPDSDLRIYPYPDGVSIFGGLFINHNHHATALLIGMTLATGLAIDAWRRRGRRAFVLLAVAYGSCAALCLCAIPLTSSRAGMALILPALAGILVLTGVIPMPRMGHGKRAIAVATGLGVLALVAAWWATHWLAAAQGADPRFVIADQTFRLGWSYFPWGSGIGSFTPVFESHLPKALWMPNYANHAHNEYAQLWLTGGLAALLAMALAMLVLIAAGLRILSARGRNGDSVLAAACWVAIVIALVHSWVDFPLSTMALMTMTGMLAGLMLSAAAAAERRSQLHADAVPIAESP